MSALFPPLAFPAVQLAVRADDAGRPVVRDPVRRRFVRLTPEEWVRQHLLAHLLALGYPAGLMAVEKLVPPAAGAPARAAWRADVVAYDRDRRPRLLAECKAPGVPVAQATFDQLARYNAALRAPVLLVTNGLVHYCRVAGIDGARFVSAIPPFVTPIDAA